jgi:hypothetical protein
MATVKTENNSARTWKNWSCCALLLKCEMTIAFFKKLEAHCRMLT